MRAPAILVDTLGKPTDTVSSIQTKTSADCVKPLLTYFDSLTIMKEKYSPALLRLGEDNRRLTFIAPDTDHQYLVEKDKVLGHYVPGHLELRDAALRIRKEFKISKHPTAPREILVPQRLIDSLAGQEHCLVCDFVGSLPVPGDTTPIDDVFRFRENRSSELSKFWHCLYDVAGNAACLNSRDPTAEISRLLGRALEDCQRVASESWPKRVAKSISLRFCIDPDTIKIFAASAFGLPLVNAPPIASVFLGAFGAVRFSVDLLPKAERVSETVSGLSYALQVNDLIRQ